MIELVPTGKAVVVNVATSFETVPPPSKVEPLKKATVPVGAAEPVLAGLIVAVNVTEVPNDGELGVEVSVVVVTIGVTGGETGNVADWMNASSRVGVADRDDGSVAEGCHSGEAVLDVARVRAGDGAPACAVPLLGDVTEAGFQPFVAEKPSPTAKIFSAEEPETATRSAFGRRRPSSRSSR